MKRESILEETEDDVTFREEENESKENREYSAGIQAVLSKLESIQADLCVLKQDQKRILLRVSKLEARTRGQG